MTGGGQIDQALRMLREQIDRTPNDAQLYLSLGEALLEDQDTLEAEAALRRAVELQPSLAAAYGKLSQLLLQKNRLREAILTARTAAQHAPHSVEAILWLAGLLQQEEQPAEAEALYRRALELQPGSEQIFNLLGVVLTEQGRHVKALKHYQQAIDILPSYAAAHANRGVALLETGQFAEGWDEYEWHRQNNQTTRGYHSILQPRWDGSALADRTILIYGAQGMANEVMFATCYAEVIRQAARAFIVCDARLERLFRRSFPQATVFGVPQGGEHTWRAPQNLSIDLQAPAGTLPRFLRRGADAFPRESQLLKPSPEKMNVWQERFIHFGRQLKIGIAWQAGDGATMPSRRSIPLAQWQPILSADNVQVINLQSGDEHYREIKEFATQTGLTIFDAADADHQFDLDGLAAKIAALDLVVTADNTIAHLAGAVGTPTWVLLSPQCSWCWLAEGERSVWYRNVRLFRRGKLQQWDEVFRQLRHELLKTTFPLDEESKRESPAPPHWATAPLEQKMSHRPLHACKISLFD